MKVTLEPKAELMVITIENDEDARMFCRLACEIAAEGGGREITESRPDPLQTWSYHGT